MWDCQLEMHRNNCFNFLLYCCDKTPSKSNPGRGEFLWLMGYGSPLGKARQELKTGARSRKQWRWRHTAPWPAHTLLPGLLAHCSLACSHAALLAGLLSYFSHRGQAHAPRNVNSVGWACSINYQTRNAPQTCSQTNDGEDSSSEVLPSQVHQPDKGNLLRQLGFEGSDLINSLIKNQVCSKNFE